MYLLNPLISFHKNHWVFSESTSLRLKKLLLDFLKNWTKFLTGPLYFWRKNVQSILHEVKVKLSAEKKLVTSFCHIQFTSDNQSIQDKKPTQDQKEVLSS